jgi:osmotically-inducible protein OsmY
MGHSVIEQVRLALLLEPRIMSRQPISLELEDGTLTLEGEVLDVGAKKLAVAHAGGVAGVVDVVDRLRVVAAAPMTDEEMRQHFQEEMSRQPELLGATVGANVRGGIVTLSGTVQSLAHRRLAGVLAWWIPGVCDVVNQLEVVAPEPDGDQHDRDLFHPRIPQEHPQSHARSVQHRHLDVEEHQVR